MKLAGVLVLLATAFVACGSDDPGFGARGAWARPTPPTAANGVVYLEVTSDVTDTLVGVEAPTRIAARTELHTSDASGPGGHQHGAVGGEVTMSQVEEVVVEAGETIEFRPGGNHVMLVGLERPLELGDTFPLTLRFSSGRTLETPVVVADNPPS